MIIGVDGNEANVQHKVGVSVYTIQLLHYFQKKATKDLQFIVYLRKKPNPELPPESEYFIYKVIWGPILWSQLFLPLHLLISKLTRKNIHVFFSPAHYIPRFCPFKTVVTIHDLSYLYFPNEFLKKDLYQLNNWTKYALNKSFHIIAVSKTTKKDIIHEYAIPEEKISVIYNGYESMKLPTTNYELRTNSYPYFLYIGTIQPRKNLSFLVSAFAQFHKTHPDYKLILAGKKGWLYEDIFKQVEQIGLKDSIMFPGYVSEEEKNNLYRKAVAFILPSLYEGFGIPLLEAMAHSCPVISSFSSSLPEIGGEACLYFDPKNEEDLVERMKSIVSDAALKKKLVTTGRERIKLFSWDTTGDRTLHILQSIHT